MAEAEVSPSLWRIAEERAGRLGDHPALLFEGTTYGSLELQDRARRAAGGLVDIGVERGDRVVVLMANSPEVLIAYNAIWRAGAVVTPVVFLVRGAELRHILVDSGATTVVTSAELVSGIADVAAEVPALRTVVVAGAPPPAIDGVRTVAFGELETADIRDPVAESAGALAALLYTGGTTGRAKGVALTHANLAFTGQATQRLAHVAGVTRSLTPLPLSHAYGMLVTVAGMYEAEPGFAVVQRWFDPEQWVALCVSQRVQRSSLVPAMVAMLLAQPLEEHDLTALRYIGSGAAPLAADVREEFERRVPGCEIDEGYGLTESGAIIAANPPGRRRAGSVGLPIPGCEVRVVDDDDRALPAGADGEICARSPGVMSGYWHADDITAMALRGGWLHTGDIGHLDADGYLYIVDRKKDLILRGGFNVFPRDVEDVLVTHPAVAMAGVVGKPDARMGEEVVAFVMLRPGASATTQELIAHARSALSPTKYPRDVRIVDHIPLTSVGKLDRKALRALVRDSVA